MSTTAVSSGPRAGKDSKATWARGLAIAGSLLLVSVMVVGGSRAAFTDTTKNEGNTWDAANVELDDDAMGVLFETDLMVPGDKDSADLTVTYSGSAASVDVRLYAEDYTSSDDAAGEDFGEVLNLKIGTTLGGSEVFDGTLAGFNTAHSDFSNGADNWDGATTDATRQYYFEVELDPDTSDDHQDGGAGVTFVWEAQSNATQGQ